VTHPPYQDLDFHVLASTFNLKKPYFFSPNQFWAHKNQSLVIQAVKILIKEDLDFQLVFSGKENDERNPDYFPKLKKVVENENLSNYIKFLGFIDRKEQLQIMNNSVAVIQPSLFEGWSTVVEDAKAMNKYILASNLNVHKEQISCNGEFFNPDKPEELVLAMKRILKQEPSVIFKDYDDDIKNFGNNFINIVNKIIK
jgi:glycosyltransferase involved in cell wall biosynthesis